MLRKSNFKKSRNQLEGFSPNLQTDKPYVPQELCTSCPSCKAMLFQNDLEENNEMCIRDSHKKARSPRHLLSSKEGGTL